MGESRSKKASPCSSLHLEVPKVLTFSADNPVGVKFPGFEEGDTGAAAANTDDKGDYKFPGMPEMLPTSGKGGGADDDDDDDSDDDVEVSDADSDSDSDSS